MTTFFGFVIGLGLMIGAIILTAKESETAMHVTPTLYQLYLNPGAFMLVFGGTLSATLVAHPFTHLLKGFKGFFIAFTHGAGDFITPVEEICDFATSYTKGGVLALEEKLKDYKKESLLKDAIGFIINGFKPDEVRSSMEIAISRRYDSEYIDVHVFRNMGKVSPAFGLVGTLIGLIFMLQVMGDNPKSVGPFLSVALTATLYGVIFTNLIFNPIANKLTHRAELNLRFGKLTLDGIMLILEKRHPIFIKDKLSVFVPPAQREKLYKKEEKA